MSAAFYRQRWVQAVAVLGWVGIAAVAVALILPARIVIGDAVILPTGGCVQRVSTRGVIHAPDSPHWAQTGTTRCLDTE